MSTVEEDAALLISTIEQSFKVGYTFCSMKNTPLLTVIEVIAALVADKQIIIHEPDNEYSYIFHKGEVR